jgi:hypothetical protein
VHSILEAVRTQVRVRLYLRYLDQLNVVVSRWHEAGWVLGVLQFILNRDPPIISFEASLRDRQNCSYLAHSLQTPLKSPTHMVNSDHPPAIDVIIGENIDNSEPIFNEIGINSSGDNAEVGTSFVDPDITTDWWNSNTWASGGIDPSSDGDQFNTLDTLFRLFDGRQGTGPNELPDLTTGWWNFPSE